MRQDVSRRRRRPQNRQRRGKRREDREDRGERQWHGDHRDRWHQPASTATDPLMNNDPWRPALRERSSRPPASLVSRQPLAPGQQVSVGDVPGVGRIRCWRKRPPPPGFYDEQPPPPPKESHVEPSHTDAEMDAGHVDGTVSVVPEQSESNPVRALDCPDPSVEISKPPVLDHDMSHVESLPEPPIHFKPRDMSDIEEGGGGQCGPTTGSGKEWMKGTLEELDDATSPHGPVQSWKENVQERQKQRASVKVQNNQYSSKYDKRGSSKLGRKQSKFEVFMMKHRPPKWLMFSFRT